MVKLIFVFAIVAILVANCQVILQFHLILFSILLIFLIVSIQANPTDDEKVAKNPDEGNADSQSVGESASKPRRRVDENSEEYKKYKQDQKDFAEYLKKFEREVVRPQRKRNKKNLTIDSESAQNQGRRKKKAKKTPINLFSPHASDFGEDENFTIKDTLNINFDAPQHSNDSFDRNLMSDSEFNARYASD